MNEAVGPPKLYRMAEAAALVGKSLRWLQYHLKANPCGRMAGRTRLFADADLSRLIDTFPVDRPTFVPARLRQRPHLPLRKTAVSLRANLPNHRPLKHPRKGRIAAD